MTTAATLLPGENGRNTFDSAESFRTFLGFQARHGGDGQHRCMAATAAMRAAAANRSSKNRNPIFGCGHPLGSKKASQIDVEIHKFCEAGFPSPEAEECLWRIAVNSICSVNRDRHHVMVTGASSTRSTQYQYLYDMWHGNLWVMYWQKHNPSLRDPLRGYDVPPPPLHSAPAIWRERATDGPRKPLLLKRALTASSIHVSGTRLVELFSRLSIRRPRLGGPSRGKKEEAEPQPRFPDANCEVQCPRCSENDAASSASSISETPSALEPTVLAGLERHDDDPFGPTTPHRPRLTRDSDASKQLTEIETDDSPEEASLLFPSPDSFDSGKAISIFSNPEKGQGSDVGTPFSDHHSDPQTPNARSNPLLGEEQEKEKKEDINPRHDGRHSRYSLAGEQETPTRMPHVRQLSFTEDISLREGEAETVPEVVSSAGEDIVLYYQSHVEEVSPLQKKLQGKFRDVKIGLKQRKSYLPRAPPRSPNAKSADSETALSIASEPTTVPPLVPLGLESNDKPNEALRDMLCGLHGPILDKKSFSAGWVYGLAIAGCEEPWIKIGVSGRPADRKAEISSKCKMRLITLFEARMPCAAEVMETMVHKHLWEQQRSIKCHGCGRRHREWYEVGLEEALESVLTWQEFSKSRPYVEETRSLDTAWYPLTVPAWDACHDSLENSNPAHWVENYFRPALAKWRSAPPRQDRELGAEDRAASQSWMVLSSEPDASIC